VFERQREKKANHIKREKEGVKERQKEKEKKRKDSEKDAVPLFLSRLLGTHTNIDAM